jgi:hypothetical protein
MRPVIGNRPGTATNRPAPAKGRLIGEDGVAGRRASSRTTAERITRSPRVYSPDKDVNRGVIRASRVRQRPEWVVERDIKSDVERLGRRPAEPDEAVCEELQIRHEALPGIITPAPPPSATT